MSWDSYFMGMLDYIANKSKDPSTRCGALIIYPDNGICSTGFNGFARGVLDSPEKVNSLEILDLFPKIQCQHEGDIGAAVQGIQAAVGSRLINRETKLKLTIHAEPNAIINAAKHGHCTQGCTIYVNRPPCSNCAAAIIQAGIVRVIFRNNADYATRWAADTELTLQQFAEAGVEVVAFEESSDEPAAASAQQAH